jgi:hypothetical protein
MKDAILDVKAREFAQKLEHNYWASREKLDLRAASLIVELLGAINKAESDLSAANKALRFYANKKNWNPVAAYASDYWYIAGRPWMMAVAALKDAGVEFDMTAATDLMDPLSTIEAGAREQGWNPDQCSLKFFLEWKDSQR